MLLSIVVSVYKVDKYIDRCLESIVDSRLDDYEIILVVRKGDFSYCKKICEKYSAEYEFVSLVEQDKTGLSNARNVALSVAKGKYIMFLDADDYVASQLLKTQYNILNELDVQLIVNDFNMVDEDGNIIHTRKQIPENTVLGNEYTDKYLNEKGSIWNIWRYTYSLQYLKDNTFLFLENRLCEDVDFTTRIFLNATDICYVHNPFYNYFGNRDTSLVNNTNKKNNIDLIDICKSLIVNNLNNKDDRDIALLSKLQSEILLSMNTIKVLNKDDRKYVEDYYKDNLDIFKYIHNTNIMLLYGLMRIVGIKNFSFLLHIAKKLKRWKRYGKRKK